MEYYNRKELEECIHRLGYVQAPNGDRCPVEGDEIITAFGPRKIYRYGFAHLEAMYQAARQGAGVE